MDDEGPGVPEPELERIFERYYSARMESSEDSAGDAARNNVEHHFGIGLWIIRRNIHAIGGRVAAENRAGRGLRVVVTLPRI